MPPATVAARREKLIDRKPAVCISALNSVFTPMKNIGGVATQLGNERT